MELRASDLEMACRWVAMTELGSWSRGTTQCSRSLRCAHATRVLPQSEVETFGCSSAILAKALAALKQGSAVLCRAKENKRWLREEIIFHFHLTFVIGHFRDSFRVGCIWQ